ncbi:MucR family transcriptional regulator [Brevundimonas aurantiaca]|uniref:MucR family transcriptional regulator n=1 Tax=Brevundimonas aurantiaca TaxID=74316 RepID=UPI001CD5CA8C|nr:MucR family transcriptional regulator [Brevundimonas aurantiaca]
MTDTAAPTTDLVALTADIVSVYVANNAVAADAVPGVIAAVYAAFAGLGDAVEAAADPAPAPAVTARKSLADPDRIVSMIDGRPYSSLTRHLRTHGLTPDDYRARYKLPADYPMIAPGYSARRSALAKTLGLGRKPKVKPSAPAAPEPKTRRGRKSKAAKAG